MSRIDHHDYLARRRSQENQAAAAAANPGIRRIHLDLAKSYDERLAALVPLPATA